jgi:flagellar biosynthesis protein
MRKKPQKAKDNRPSALALRYNKDKEKAPRLLAKGKGRIAEEIIRRARESGVPVKEDADLMELLYPLELGEEIPPELYRVVAELLAYVYKMNKKAAVQ